MRFRETDERHATGHPRSRRGLYMALFGSLAVISFASCVYDSDNRCGPHQVLKNADGDACVCDQYSAGTAAGCVPCGTNEVGGPTGCQCAAGFGKSSPTEPCTFGVTADAGTSNNQGDADTSQAVPCMSNTDCTNGYACALKASPSVCVKPPLGLGKTCSSSSDCAGTEATFCDAVVTKACAVEGCSLTSNDCFPGYVCCDLAKFGVPTTLCTVGACL